MKKLENEARWKMNKSMKWSWFKVPVKVEHINEYLFSDTQWRIQGGPPRPSALRTKFSGERNNFIWLCDSSTRLLICIYLFWGLSAMANGQWPFCYACALENQSFITNFTRHASHYTIQWTHSRTHTYQYDIILYYSICCTVLWRHTVMAWHEPMSVI